MSSNNDDAGRAAPKNTAPWNKAPYAIFCGTESVRNRSLDPIPPSRRSGVYIRRRREDRDIGTIGNRARGARAINCMLLLSYF